MLQYKYQMKGDNIMARKFYFKDVTLKHNKMYGYNTQEVSIYYLDNEGAPHLIDRINYQTGSTPGNKQEVFKYLSENGYVSQKYKGKNYYDSGAYKVYKLFEMF